MQENSKKCLLRTENKSFFLSVYACIGCFGVLKGEIKKLDFINTGARSRAPLLCFASRMIMARNLAKFL